MDNKMANLMAEIENAQQVADDVRNETAKMNMEIKKAKEKRLHEIRKITEDFRKLMWANKIDKIESERHRYNCGSMVYNQTSIEIVSNLCGIRINTRGGHDAKEVYTCSYGDIGSHCDKLDQDFLLENWDMIYNELLDDFKIKFDNSLADVHNDYENVVAVYNDICKGV